MELSKERRGELALIALMELVSRMPANHLKVQKLSDKFRGYIRNLPKGAVMEIDDVSTLTDFSVWAEAIIYRHTGVRTSIGVDERRFGLIAYALMVAYYWSEDLPLGANLHRRIYSNQRDGVSDAEVYALIADITRLFLKFMEPKES